MEHKGTKRLETERLILRPFEAGDGEAMFRNWAGDPEVTKFLTWPAYESVDPANQMVTFWAAESRKPDVYQWAVELREPGEPIGSISATNFDDRVNAAEIGYCIGKRWWGQGLTPEALRAVVRYLIVEVGMSRVYARHDVNNPNSGKVMQKAGMTKEGVLRAAGRNNQGIVDMAEYSILAREYQA